MFWNQASKPKSGLGSRPTREQSLAMRPAKGLAVREEPMAQAQVRLIYPVVIKPWFVGLAKSLGLGSQTMTRTVELDELGSFCWRLVDGKRDVLELARLMAERFGLGPREAEMAVAAFLRDLGRHEARPLAR